MENGTILRLVFCGLSKIRRRLEFGKWITPADVLWRSEIEKEVRMWEMDLSRVGWVWREGNIDGS